MTNCVTVTITEGKPPEEEEEDKTFLFGLVVGLLALLGLTRKKKHES